MHEAQCSSPPEGCQLFGEPHNSGEKQARACFGHLGICRASGATLWEIVLQLKSCSTPWIPRSQQTPLPLCWQLRPSSRLSRAKSALHPAPRQSVPVEGAMCCPDLFFFPGARVDSCPLQSKSGPILLCGTGISISSRLLPDTPGYPK